MVGCIRKDSNICDLFITGTTKFDSNSAADEGGAIKYSHEYPKIDDAVLERSKNLNTAPYGNLMASYPKKMKLENYIKPSQNTHALL